MFNVKGGGESPLSSLRVEIPYVPLDEYVSNAEWSSSRYDLVEQQEFNDRQLAVVGGGGSVSACLEELRSWEGDIWSVKGTVKWLAEAGIKSTVISCHPVYDGEDWPEYADGAIVSSSCPRSLFEALKCDTRIFNADIAIRGSKITGGCTTLAKTPHLSVVMGYSNISFFGCDSSMETASHVYIDKSHNDRMLVKCGGAEFKTQPDWIWQAEYMQQVFAMAPHIYKNRSGGFMQAMCENNGIYEVIL